MNAVRFSRFSGPEVLEIVDLPAPVPGPAQIRIAARAAGVNASDWKKRQGLMDQQLPQTLGYEAAGIVDALGAGVADVAVGDRVFGFCVDAIAQAEFAILLRYAPMPPSLGLPLAAALPAAVETAARALDQLGVSHDHTLLINVPSEDIGAAAARIAVARGALGEVAALVGAGRFTLPPVKTFPLAAVAEAHRLGESGRAAGSLCSPSNS